MNEPTGFCRNRRGTSQPLTVEVESGLLTASWTDPQPILVYHPFLLPTFGAAQCPWLLSFRGVYGEERGASWPPPLLEGPFSRSSEILTHVPWLSSLLCVVALVPPSVPHPWWAFPLQKNPSTDLLLGGLQEGVQVRVLSASCTQKSLPFFTFLFHVALDSSASSSRVWAPIGRSGCYSFSVPILICTPIFSH